MGAVACNPRELIDLARRGDVAALDHLTRCQGERLLSIGRRYCRSEEDAHDAVQDALVNAATHLPDYRGDGPLEGWVVRMVARACGRLRRGRKNDPALHAVDVDLASDDDSPEVRTGRARIAGLLGEAMLELSPQDRTILLLAEAEGATGPEIAEQLGLSHAAVRTRLTRIRRRMRELLDAGLGADAI
jgi:RNA polymerase sigma-70 factor (ECF subfamily)